MKKKYNLKNLELRFAETFVEFKQILSTDSEIKKIVVLARRWKTQFCWNTVGQGWRTHMSIALSFFFYRAVWKKVSLKKG